MSRENVGRLRQLLSEAVPSQQVKSIDESDAWRRYQAFAENDPLPDLDTSTRARQIRNVNRIAVCYGWAREIQSFLDRHDCAGIGSLSDVQVEQLNRRMVTLEDCVQNGCDPPDMPAAR